MFYYYELWFLYPNKTKLFYVLLLIFSSFINQTWSEVGVGTWDKRPVSKFIFTLVHNKQGGDRDNISSCDLNAAYPMHIWRWFMPSGSVIVLGRGKEEQRQRTQSQATKSDTQNGSQMGKGTKGSKVQSVIPSSLEFSSTHTHSKVNLDQRT
jgi:hypothetical protein